MWTNTCSPNTIFLIITPMNGYYSYSRWYSHFGKHNHYWSNLCGPCFVNRFFPRRSCDNYSSGKGCVISWPIPWRWFHPSNNKDIWMFTLVGEQLPSLMCQHGMVNKGLQCPPLLIIRSFIGKECQWLFKKFKSPLSCIKQLWQHERPLLGMVSFQVFHPSPCTTCFMLLLMGLGLFCVFSS
jgi:hypothetical protein